MHGSPIQHVYVCDFWTHLHSCDHDSNPSEMPASSLFVGILGILGRGYGLNQEASSCWRSSPWCIWGHRDPGQGWTAGWCWRKSGSSAIKWGPHHKSSQCGHGPIWNLAGYRIGADLHILNDGLVWLLLLRKCRTLNPTETHWNRFGLHTGLPWPPLRKAMTDQGDQWWPDIERHSTSPARSCLNPCAGEWPS